MLNYLFYLLGFLPSFAWLLFYLRKDSHPESNSTVIKIFALGMLAGFFAILLERSFQKIHAFFSGSISTETILYIFVGVALIEELVKFLAVRLTVFRSVEFDEPLDLMLYMIIVALGFAALENILVLGNEHLIGNFWKSLEIMGWRFVSATFLHGLCSGVLGYFLALSLHDSRRRKEYVFSGFLIAFGLHGVYNWSIIKLTGSAKFFAPLAIFIILGFLVFYGFRNLKKMKSVCEVNRH